MKRLQHLGGQLRHARSCSACRTSCRKWSDERDDVLRALAQRRQPDGHHVEPVVEVLAEVARARSPSPAPGWSPPPRGVSTRTLFLPPTRKNSSSCRTWSSLACSRMAISPISSRKMVPWSASSNLPGFSAVAPVKAPRSWPNSSLSSSSAGQRRAVHLDERPAAAPAARVDLPRDDLLARAGLAQQQHRHVRVRDALHQRARAAHGRGDGDELRAARSSARAVHRRAGCGAGFGAARWATGPWRAGPPRQVAPAPAPATSSSSSLPNGLDR